MSIATSTYAWCITKDHLYDGEILDRDERGTVGPHNAPLLFDEIVAHPGRRKFRMYDDDGELYYEGWLVILDGHDSECGEGFEPLDDFGKPNAGATEIHYFTPGQGGGWKTL